MEIMATSKNYGKKKVRITSGIFWTLMGKNLIMEKSDAGAACLSWTFFFSIILSATIYIYIYGFHLLSNPVNRINLHRSMARIGKENGTNSPQKELEHCLNIAWTLLEQVAVSLAGNWAVHSMLRYPSTWQPWRCRSNILRQHARTWLHWWQIHGIFIFPIPKENSRNN